jgi:hypothetical protein
MLIRRASVVKVSGILNKNAVRNLEINDAQERDKMIGKPGHCHLSKIPDNGRLLTHRQHHPETRLAAFHTFVSFGDAFQWINLIHRTHAGKHAELQCIL